MATLEDKLAGEKLHYYCSSSEDEGDYEKYTSAKDLRNETSLSKDITHWSGTSQNTGPKGVVQDWQLYKQLEAEKRKENEKQKIELIKKLSMATTTIKEDEQRQQNDELDKELEELMSEDFLQEFQRKRMMEMMQACDQKKIFGKVFTLNSRSDFLEAVEKEDKTVVVVIHIFDKSLTACDTLNKCLAVLADDYKFVKFCKISSNIAGMSLEFKQKGLPALLVYRGAQLTGNFVRITDELTDDFFPSDLESFLIDNDVITDKNILKF